MTSRNSARWMFSVLTPCFLLAGLACTQHAGKATLGRSHRAASVSVEFPPDRFLSHIAFLAHDEMAGRDNGTEELNLAAGYIAGRFAAAGIAPGGPDGSYFKEYTVDADAELSDETNLTFDGAGGRVVLYEDFIPFGFSPTGSFDGELVFVGYGVTAEEEGFDDYAGIDVEDKVVLMLRREPPELKKGRSYTRHARFDSKMKLAVEKGAAAVVIVNQDPGEDGIDALRPFGGGSDPEEIPAVHIRRGLADELLVAGGLRSLSELQTELDEMQASVSAPLDGVRASGRVAYGSPDMLLRNVMGMLPGTGPHADEYIVIGGHYDHVGTRSGRVYNGADDNASGTAGVIEICTALAQTPARDRGVICMAFSGEEIGLYGSEHFVDQPTVPLESVVTMINLDMIGRLDPDDIENILGIIGLGTGSTFKEIVDRNAEDLGIEYFPDDSAKAPSDSYSFDAVEIPSLFFNTGMHYDLHQPTDDLEKINAEGGAQVCSLIYRIVLDLVNDDQVPTFVEISDRVGFMRSSGGVVMGIMPDREDDPEAPGWSVGFVSPGGGAEKAGMMGGDRIISIDGHSINGFGDYKQTTKGKQPGDVIEVTVQRGDKELKLAVELAARE